MTTPQTALLGTGIIGSGMARNIAAAGIPLTVWNRTAAKGLGATGAQTPAKAAAGAEVLITVLADADSVAAAVRDAAPAAGTIWVQSATVGVEGAAMLAALAEDLGLVYVDAPVLGTKG